MKIDKTL